MTANNKTKKPVILWIVIGLILFLLLWFGISSDESVQAPTDVPKSPPTAVIYPIDDWQLPSRQSAKMTDIKAVLGDVIQTQSSLDFYGRPATLSYYRQAFLPPLYTVESDRLFELVWYYPTPTDSDADKRAGQEYAKRAYELMGVAAGELGANLIKALVQGKTISKLDLGDFYVVQAACKPYRCRVILSY